MANKVVVRCPAVRPIRTDFCLPFFAHTTTMLEYEKIYVGMILHIDTDGNMKPVAIEWVNGEQYEITKITDKRQAPPRHVGSTPTVRYTVQVQGRVRELYRESFSGRWFIEKLV
ncbi:MAG: hypothetical protein K2I30_05540 [Clostridia bacterium]|nr:hypothetical protein [Clostridia bacterium]